jgi:hypothetical protein
MNLMTAGALQPGNVVLFPKMMRRSSEINGACGHQQIPMLTTTVKRSRVIGGCGAVDTAIALSISRAPEQRLLSHCAPDVGPDDETRGLGGGRPASNEKIVPS